MTLKFINLEGLENFKTKFLTLKTNQKTHVIKINFISENHAFYQQVYRLLPLFYHFLPFELSRTIITICGIWPTWKWDRGNVWPPINGVIWLDFIIVASLCYKTWISLKYFFKRNISKSVIRSATVRFIHGSFAVSTWESELWIW